MTPAVMFLRRLQLLINRHLGDDVGEFETVTVDEERSIVEMTGGLIPEVKSVVFTSDSYVEPRVVSSAIAHALAIEGVTVWADLDHTRLLIDGGKEVVVVRVGRGGYIFTLDPPDPVPQIAGRPFEVVGLGKYRLFHDHSKEMRGVGMV